MTDDDEVLHTDEVLWVTVTQFSAALSILTESSRKRRDSKLKSPNLQGTTYTLGGAFMTGLQRSIESITSL